MNPTVGGRSGPIATATNSHAKAAGPARGIEGSTRGGDRISALRCFGTAKRPEEQTTD